MTTTIPTDAGLDTDKATDDAVALVSAVFQGKSSGDPARFLASFSQQQLTYGDGTRGAKYTSWAELEAAIAPVIPTWPATARMKAARAC